jgi:small subunit ribosomal protein S27Ae
MAKKEEPKAAAPAPAPVKAPVGVRGRVPIEAPPVEEKKPKKEKKSQKERPHSKKKHKKVQIWKLYKMEGGKLTRKNEPCPRCGSGTFLAKYKARKYCGKCGWAHVGKAE